MLGHFEINWYILDACAWGIFKNEVKFSGKNISLKIRNMARPGIKGLIKVVSDAREMRKRQKRSRKIRKGDAREMRKRQKRSKFHANHFQSRKFFPISNRKGAMTS